MLKRGSTIGILGGGQLGRMMATSAAQLGYRCIGYAPEGDNVSGAVSEDFVTADWDDETAFAAFAGRCDAVTWEFENVPVATARAIQQAKIFPAPLALETAQDRLNEKRFVEGLGGRPAAYAKVDTSQDLEAAVDRLGAPGILKTRRDGYDGKGQWRIGSAREAAGLRMPEAACIYEAFVEFEAEFSVILVRSRDGEIRFWDSPRNVHAGGILASSHYPAGEQIAAQVTEARELARKVADALKYVGVLTLEFFATRDGPIFNEMAPRVHNSGHWTIEGAATSQFENHIRAVAGLPLGDTRTTAAAVEMRNILGADIDSAHAKLGDARVHLHDYGKAEASEGRKMGHMTLVTLDTRG
ncbi:5-(carboxyamino)imidazole ribonucleotide synthase [Qipengyuania huizhouensis]|uniref:5-(carboxyamino)imidazole ribonucleotide synthase n=1 Tax=Qipengyuania huizhouensis TaxID=2867245 RepID=UPI00185634CE|nr:5-(carboxyamino)imidazole ribonucleotide synthase [Qipengyuania huizhouensis]MBA4764291.1 5-(carboxyamino)imidazole ribonucleotide synthase [Erythrobacter sp.]MBX7460001.1 5-(carboxyamino)imidazole ribonucleotide synthase [Qipengyuania huizhouensis]